MPGAYVAKPDADITPNIPDGWNTNWPYPGPFPPEFDWVNHDWSDYEGDPNDPDNPDKTISVVAFPSYGDTSETGSLDCYIGVFIKAQKSSCLKSNVTVTFSTDSENSDEIDIGGQGIAGSVLFGTGEVGVVKRLRITGKNDNIIDGDAECIVNITTTSDDPDYVGLEAPPIIVTNKEIVTKIIYYLTITSKTLPPDDWHELFFGFSIEGDSGPYLVAYSFSRGPIPEWWPWYDSPSDAFAAILFWQGAYQDAQLKQCKCYEGYIPVKVDWVDKNTIKLTLQNIREFINYSFNYQYFGTNGTSGSMKLDVYFYGTDVVGDILLGEYHKVGINVVGNNEANVNTWFTYIQGNSIEWVTP